MRRRAFLAASVATPPAILLGSKVAAAKGDMPYGPLTTTPDALGILLPEGFTARLVATSGELVAGTDYEWHVFPDGGACFATDDGGWIYVSNSEVGPGTSGVGALMFDADANVVDAYSILTGSARNCGGGATPWGTWLSGEEVETGKVFECDPTGKNAAVELPSLGRFIHEAVCIDTDREQLYLTEDAPDGGLYRFTPDAYPDLSAGLLEVAGVTEGTVTWHTVPDPLAATTATRAQVAEYFPFNGGEGIYYRDEIIWFVTKGDHGVWKLDANTDKIEQIYKGSEEDGVLGEPDNVVITSYGDVLICEDQGADQQVVLVTADGAMSPIMQLVGQEGSELAGAAMNPAGDRMYVSSQRGGGGGLTYEIAGPFRSGGASASTTTTVSSQTTALATATRPAEAPDDPPAFLLVGVGGALVAAIGYGVYKLRDRNSG